jgi:hypothetical protein
MNIEMAILTAEHLDLLPFPEGTDKRAYLSEGSVGCCIIADGQPVLAGGIVNMMWNRGEAWTITTPWFRRHLRWSLRMMLKMLPRMSANGKFIRVQATCPRGVSAHLFRHLGFAYEGTMEKFGPHGETCDLYCRIFEVVQ